MEAQANSMIECKMYSENSTTDWGIHCVEGSQITTWKYMALDKETTHGKILWGKSYWFYDNGDNTISAVKIKHSKGIFSQHKKKIVDFTIPQKIIIWSYFIRWRRKSASMGISI